MGKLFQTYEVGSLPKLNARVKAISGEYAREQDILEIKDLSTEYNAPYEEVVGILERQRKEQRKLTSQERSTLIDFNALLYIKMQESKGLDFVYDGEARRAEMYRHVVKYTDGFEDSPEMIRSRGPDSWRQGICVAEPTLKNNSLEKIIGKEFDFVNKNASKPIKVPIDDPYMIAVMSDNRHYIDNLRNKFPDDPKKLKYEAKLGLTLALAKNVIRPQVEYVVGKGAKWVQLDIPAATLDVGHIPIVVEGVNAVTKGIKDVKFSLHMCYPRRATLTDKTGYELLFPHVLKLNDNINHFSIELANNDDYENDLKVFKQYADQRKFEIGLGVVDITLEKQQKGITETSKIVRNRILKATEILGDPKLIFPAPDCGMRQLGIRRCATLYEALVEGANMARNG